MTTDPKMPGLQITANQAGAVLMRGFLIAFLPWAFGVLHPTEKPLRLEWYLRALCQAFQKASVGRSRRLVINMPPRHLKSVTAAVFAAWMLGRSPELKIMIATYGDKLGRDHLERLIKIMSHPFYAYLFPNTRLLSGAVGRGFVGTTAGGGCRVVTVNGATTGFGADIIVIDDAMKAEDIVSEARRGEVDRFYRQTLLTRLNDKRSGVIISIQQRLGEDDLPAKMIEAGAEHLCLPAYDDKERIYDIGFGRRYRRPVGEVLRPDDEPMEVLDRLRSDMGPRDFATQYLQQPGALEGNLIPLARIPRFNLSELDRSKYVWVAQSWDTAASEEPNAAYSVCLTFAYFDNRWHLVHALRQRLAFARLRDMVLALNKHWKPDHVLIEDASSGSHLYEDLRFRGNMHPIMVRPDTDKVTRMIGQLGLIEDGLLAIPEDAPWLDDFLGELRLFPTSKYFDQIDSLSQFLEWAKRRDVASRDPVTGRRISSPRRTARRK